VVLPDGVIVLPVIWVPPVAADVLNHPTKLWPALVGLGGRVPIGAPTCLVWFCVVGVPPLALKVRLTF